jgi:hypothetical protein
MTSQKLIKKKNLIQNVIILYFQNKLVDRNNENIIFGIDTKKKINLIQ